MVPIGLQRLHMFQQANYTSCFSLMSINRFTEINPANSYTWELLIDDKSYFSLMYIQSGANNQSAWSIRGVCLLLTIMFCCHLTLAHAANNQII